MVFYYLQLFLTICLSSVLVLNRHSCLLKSKEKLATKPIAIAECIKAVAIKNQLMCGLHYRLLQIKLHLLTSGRGYLPVATCDGKPQHNGTSVTLTQQVNNHNLPISTLYPLLYYIHTNI